MNLAATEGDVVSEANVTDIHEALNFNQNDSVSAHAPMMIRLYGCYAADCRGQTVCHAV